jgi:prepilin-type N-terminal cleavage/methylation domain-containing protein
MRKRGTEGFTLMEIIMVLVILSILSTVAVASMKDFARRANLQSAIDMIAADIRLARLTTRTSAESSYIVYDPGTSSYTLNGARRIKLPEGVRFGSDPTVTGKPSQPYEAPPADGISFESEGIKNQARFYPKGTVIPTGAVYVTNGKETMAITVSISGRTKTWRSCGGKKWVSL